MSWIHRILGKDGSSQLAVDPLHFAARMSVRPAEVVGSYRIAVTTGTLAAALAANAVVFSARWGDATKIALITSVRTRFLPLTPFTAATLTDHTSFGLWIGRSFTAAHTGGTALTLTGDNAKMRQTLATSAFTDMRIATTAALGGGTVTFDTQAVAVSIRKGNRVNPAAATEETIQPSTDGMDLDLNIVNGDYPIVLAQNEGIAVRNRTVWPAAGTGILAVTVSWLELANAAAY